MAKVCSVVSTGPLSEAKQWAAAFRPTAPEICAETLQRILGSHDRPIIEAAARAKLERVLRYYDEGHVNLLIVTIIESAENENVLVAPVIEAVHSVMTRRREWTEKGSEWLEAFDHLPPLMTILEVMRELDLFKVATLWMSELQQPAPATLATLRPGDSETVATVATVASVAGAQVISGILKRR